MKTQKQESTSKWLKATALAPSNKRYFLSILALAGVMTVLSACGNKNDGEKEKGSSSPAPVPTLSFPQVLRFQGVDSVSGQACVTPTISVHSRLEYCQVLKDDTTFGECARDQRDRLFLQQACNTVIAQQLGGESSSTAVLCRAIETRQIENTGLARLFGRSATMMNVQAQTVRPGAQGGRQILRSGSKAVVVDQVTGSGSSLQARMSIGSSDMRASFNARVSPASMMTMTDLDGQQIILECMPATSTAAVQRPATLQPHFPQVTVTQTGQEISTGQKIKCEGSVRLAGSSQEMTLQSEEIEVLDVMDGESVSLFSENDIEISLSVKGQSSGALRPFYQIRAEGLGKDAQYIFETAGDLNRPQTLEVGGRQNDNASARVRVTCRPNR